MSFKPDARGDMRWAYNAILNQPGWHATAAVSAKVTVVLPKGRAITQRKPWTYTFFQISDCATAIPLDGQEAADLLPVLSQLRLEFIAAAAPMLTADGWDIEYTGSCTGYRHSSKLGHHGLMVEGNCNRRGVRNVYASLDVSSHGESVSIDLGCSQPAGATNALLKLNKIERALKGTAYHHRQARRMVA